jgi:hypothetical protein
MIVQCKIAGHDYGFRAAGAAACLRFFKLAFKAADNFALRAVFCGFTGFSGSFGVLMPPWKARNEATSTAQSQLPAKMGCSPRQVLAWSPQLDSMLP